MEKIASIYQRALERKGSETNLQMLIQGNASLAQNKRELSVLGSDRFLSEFTKKVFQSGFVWRVVEQKWPDFEEQFFQFSIEKILMMPDEMLEQKAANPKIIRNFKKVQTIKANAQMIYDVDVEQGSFAEFIANWPETDIIGLWAYLKKHGQRLGGNTGPYALRALGKDTFLLSRDVEAYFRSRDLISGGLSSKTSLTKIQACFNEWQQQSGYSMQTISRLIALSCGDNYVPA
ncbi:DNA-3-methyladenine glycosylase I [Thalassotalea ponticola]|uniref:DNA-3-methyladenine glycosylase I n=1 Tax=Thalassotalea ponticola TaxID=1523392 RepID=UPI0025B2CC4B|nr:DNA-3-methyladenine glycosylase I [Thalassotalea ponticola]MDN3652942.1 DNA-3-methyladenine glycosylase I [Thalassotalea ponticola]